jgi:DNA ligase-1
MIEKVASAIWEIKNTSGRNDKIALLKKYSDMVGFKETMHFLFNPYERTCIGAKKLSNYKANFTSDRRIDLLEAIGYFKEHPTGTDADVLFAHKFIISQVPDEKAVWLAEALSTKTISIGITDKTLTKIYGKGFIDRIGIMLGEKYVDKKDKAKFPYIVTEKHDGNRRLLVKENGIASVYTRTGLPDYGCVDIEAEAQYLPDNTVYDGECLAMGVFKNSIEQRQATASIMNSKGIKKGITFNVFDSVPLKDFKEDAGVENALQRKVWLGAIFGDTSIKYLTPNYEQLIEQFKVDFVFTAIKHTPILGVAWTEEDIYKFAEPIWKRGWEGVMLNSFTGVYRQKRTIDLLKVKNVESMDLTVIDVEEGKPTGKYAGMMGNLVVDYKGVRVGVGSGFNDEQRTMWFNNPSLIIGRTIEIDTFGESKNQAGGISLNCAIFKAVRDDK